MNEDNSAPADGTRSRREFLAAAALTLAAASLPAETPEPQQRAELDGDELAHYNELYEKHGAGRTNLAYGFALRSA